MYVRIQYAFYMKTILAIKRALAFAYTHTYAYNRTHHTHAYTDAGQYVCMYVTQLRSMLCPCAQARQHDRSAATMRAHARALHSVALYDCVCVCVVACECVCVECVLNICNLYIVCTCVNLIFPNYLC